VDEDEKILALIAALKPGTEKDGMEAAYESLKALPFGPERDAALKQLVTDYEGRENSLKDDLTMAYDQFTTPTPEALQGPGGNPYAYTVAASPLEHLAAGVQKYQGGKEIKRVRSERESLSQSKELAMQRYQAALLKKKEDEVPWWMRQY
jgi:hypothetical protein